ncbi:MAG: AAA family ATPase [Myxococcales bacterium]|nr:AAA family ATPase [Myxococcales bacterium]
MRVERLQLENYRGFASLDVTFAATGPTVFIGENGSGKSSIMRALEMWARQFDAVSNFDASDVRVGAERFDLELTASVDGEPVVWGAQSFHALTFGVQERRAGPERSTHGNERYEALGRARGATRRAVARPRVEPIDDPKRIVVLRHLLDWFRRTEDLENEVRLNDDPAHRNPELEAVRRALSTFASALPDFTIGRPRFSRVGQWANDGRGTFLLDKGDTTLGFDQLSDGESFVILLVADMARRLAEPRRSDDQPDPLQRPGILLIDEIDQHLHPRWQRAILPALGATFPNVQVIATTHSPTVVGSLPAANVVRLKDFQVVPTPHTYGRDSTTILEDVMGLPAHPTDIQRRLDDLARLIDADDLRGARAALDQLADVLGADAPEVTRYDTTLALLGEG